MAHSDNRKAEALAALDANGGNVARTARQLGIPRKTLSEWAAGRGVAEDVAEIRQQKTEALADRLETIAHSLLDSFKDKLPDASLKDAATAFGIAVDKMRLLREEPTSIQKTEAELTPEERAQRVRELLERARDRSVAAVSAGPDGRGVGPGVPTPNRATN